MSPVQGDTPETVMSNVVPFDTFAKARARRDEARVTHKPSEADAGPSLADLATKADLTREFNALRADIAQAEARIKETIENAVAAAKLSLLKWMVGMIVVQTVVILAGVKLLP